MIQLASAEILAVIGLDESFMGETDSKLMTAALNSQKIRQGRMVLAPYFDALTQFMQAQGELFLECLKVLMENSEGMLVKHITKEGSVEFVPLLQDNIADAYEVAIDEVPYSVDERERTLDNLLKFQSIAGPNVNLSPVILELLPLDNEQKQRIRKLMEPPPPQQPDPMTQQLLQSQAELQMAQAEKQGADAQKSMVETMLKEKELMNYDKEKSIEEMKVGAQAEYDFVRSLKEWQSIGQGGKLGGGQSRKRNDHAA